MVLISLISSVESIVLLHWYFTEYVCSAQYGCFLYFLDFMFSWYVAHILNDFEIVPVAPIITGITFGFTFHMRCISIVRSLYFRIFSASFLITFLSPEIASSINIHVPFSLSRIIDVWFVYYYYYYHHHHLVGSDEVHIYF